MNLGMRYYHGLVDVYVDDTVPNRYNRSFYITLGIPIGAHSPSEDEKNRISH